MDWTEKQILDTLRTIEASEFDEVKIETADFRLHVRKRGAAPVSADFLTQDIAAAPLAASPAVSPAVAHEASQTAPTAPVPPRSQASVVPAGLVAVRAPMIGTFYRAPAPHAAPFVALGATVAADDTVCLIEVMKLFNTIRAGMAGKVVNILAQNAATVTKDEVLFWIDPVAP